MESKAEHLIKSPLTDYLQPLSHPRNGASSDLLILLTACLSASCGLAAQDFLLPFTPILSTS
ncbi:hypothetical protein E2C01_012755 [Portunus trituberculatus]|uniref:Uncharacterized protein n=1 Tax=Portunus trituberculatus TaxID=210409 RepID=A0A5B7DFJ6_PORTR|nr:hypothetical protein [Portunus trituberculatus]